MNKTSIPEFRLVGISLGRKTYNANGQSGIDCGQLWQTFEQEKIFNQINDKIADDCYAVYYDYDGDHTQPFAYFIGCKVTADAIVPEGLEALQIPEQEYVHYIAKGKMPDCVANVWREIWQTEYPRNYQYDFEIYSAKSFDWNNAEVDVFIGAK